MVGFGVDERAVHRPGCPGPGFSVLNQGRRLMERQKPGVLLNDFSACNAYAAGFERATAPTPMVAAAPSRLTTTMG